jgi:hypothetical protein
MISQASRSEQVCGHLEQVGWGSVDAEHRGVLGIRESWRGGTNT